MGFRELPTPETEFPRIGPLGISVNRGNGAALSGDMRAEGEGLEPSQANAHAPARPPPGTSKTLQQGIQSERGVRQYGPGPLGPGLSPPRLRITLGGGMLVAPARPHSGYPSRAALGIPASLFGRAGARQSGTVTARRGLWAIGPGRTATFEASPRRVCWWGTGPLFIVIVAAQLPA